MTMTTNDDKEQQWMLSNATVNFATANQLGNDKQQQ